MVRKLTKNKETNNVEFKQGYAYRKPYTRA